MKLSAILVAGLLSFPFVGMSSAQSVNDAQIASIVVTANQVDIDAGQARRSRSRPTTRSGAFAQLMITDHTGVNKSAIDLADQAQGHPAGQSHQPESEVRWRQEPRPPEDSQGRCVRQGVRRSRSRLSPAGHRRARQDPDSRAQRTRS